MATNKSKDAGPEGAGGSKRLPTFDGTDEVDVEGHTTNKSKDAGPEGAGGSKRLPTFDGTDDDVEGHARHKVL
jgi:hypothetical protein